MIDHRLNTNKKSVPYKSKVRHVDFSEKEKKQRLASIANSPRRGVDILPKNYIRVFKRHESISKANSEIQKQIYDTLKHSLKSHVDKKKEPRSKELSHPGYLNKTINPMSVDSFKMDNPRPFSGSPRSEEKERVAHIRNVFSADTKMRRANKAISPNSRQISTATHSWRHDRQTMASTRNQVFSEQT